MRRRWLIWSGATILVIALVLVGLTLAVGRSETSFDFLAGRRVETFRRYDDVQEMESGTHSLKADYAAILKTVRAELTAKGYQEQPGSAVDHAVFEKTGPSPDGYKAGDRIRVEIWRGSRVTHGGYGVTAADGYVTVWWHAKQRRTIFDDIRSWFGL